MNLKHILDSLSPEDKQLLRYAFEHGLTQHVKLHNDPTHFIGVNIPKENPIFQIEQEKGCWSSGFLRSVA